MYEEIFTIKLFAGLLIGIAGAFWLSWMRSKLGLPGRYPVCPVCGGLVFNSTIICPHCGKDQRSK